MIWFGDLSAFPALARRSGLAGHERTRMQRALEAVAARAPHLTGATLIQALAATGWVDAATATRLLPSFTHFDPDRYFAAHLRRLSFRGRSVTDEFRSGIARSVADLTGGGADPDPVGPEQGIRFRHGEREGIVFAFPEVSFSLGGATRAAVAEAIEEMPDVLVLIARNFAEGTAGQFQSMLRDTGIAGTLITVNLLLGMRATALRYQPPAEQVIDLLGLGRPLRSADIATLGHSPVRGYRVPVVL